jgi:uncharacterized protein (TIGR02453 family)
MPLETTLHFLDALAANNNKAWFDAHRAEYTAARAAFVDTVQEIIDNFGAIDDMGFVTAKECIYRINRDLRFSKDKSPYKTNMGAVFGPNGRKTTGRSYYLQIGPHNSFIGGGLYQPEREQLENVRGHIVEDSAPLRAILAAPDFTRYFGGMQGEQLKTAPRGVNPAHPEIDLLRYKQFLALHELTPADVVADDFVGHVLDVFGALRPFVEYLDIAAATDGQTGARRR